MKRVFLSACCVSALSFLASVAGAESVTFFYDSEAGDFIGQGGMATWTDADGAWSVNRNFDSGISLSFNEDGGSSFWSLDFAAPGSVELSPQTYLDAQRFPFQDSDRPGLSIFGEGRGCNTLTGEFTVTQALYDWFGEPVRFSASFEQHCEGAVPALNGTIDYDLEFGGTPLTEGNIVISFKDRAYEYTVGGQLIQVIPILESQGTPPSSTEGARDLAVGPDGRIHIYNGTFSPVLSSGDPATEVWEHNTFAGWSTANNVTYGGIATAGNFVFVTDMLGADSGIVRFDTADGFSAERFEMGTEYIDLNIGLDGLLYALRSNGTTVDVLEPSDMDFVTSLNLAQSVRGIAVNAAGEIFAVPLGTTIYHFDSSGVEVNSIVTTERYADIDVAADGTIVAGADDAAVVVTTEALGMFSVFNVGTGFDSAFVTLVPPPLAPSEIFQDGFESGDTSAWTTSVP